MTAIYDKVEEYLNNVGWKYHRFDEQNAFVLNVTGKNGKYKIVIRVNDGKDQVAVFVDVPVMVPGDKKEAVSEFIIRANNTRLIGGFDYDLDEGEVTYKAVADFEGVGEMDTSAIRIMMSASIFSADTFYPGFLAVLYGGAAPKEAVVDIVENRPKKKNPELNLN